MIRYNVNPHNSQLCDVPYVQQRSRRIKECDLIHIELWRTTMGLWEDIITMNKSAVVSTQQAHKFRCWEAADRAAFPKRGDSRQYYHRVY
jgi:hypothetical protein